jgi:hypothetical protein
MHETAKLRRRIEGRKEGMSLWKALSTRVLLEKSLIIPSHTLEGKSVRLSAENVSCSSVHKCSLAPRFLKFSYTGILNIVLFVVKFPSVIL